MTDKPRAFSDEQIERIADNLEGQLDFFGHETKGFLQGDWDFLYEILDNCQSCGYYVRLGETDENGNCDGCASNELEEILGANDNDPD